MQQSGATSLVAAGARGYPCRGIPEETCACGQHRPSAGDVVARRCSQRELCAREMLHPELRPALLKVGAAGARAEHRDRRLQGTGGGGVGGCGGIIES